MKSSTNFAASVLCLSSLCLSVQAIFAQEQLLAEPEELKEPFFMGLQGTVPNFQSVQVKSDRVYDYTFSKAPSDWRVQSGKWGYMPRRRQFDTWNWFGGRSEEVAAIWNKRKFSGDFSVHVYFAFIEGLMHDARNWRTNNADVGISFCGDGNHLGSGYSLILGADNNRHTVLLKQGQIIAESVKLDALFPSMADGALPYPRVVRSVTRESAGRATGAGQETVTIQDKLFGEIRWWHAIIDKFDNRIECWLDGKLLFTYDDAEPLNQGQIALWTFNNGIVLSRVQIFYENEVKTIYVKKSVAGEPIGP